MNITNEQYMTLVRAMLNLGGGAMVSAGLSSGATMETVSGIVIPLAAMIWGWVVHTPTNTVARADDMKSKGLV